MDSHRPSPFRRRWRGAASRARCLPRPLPGGRSPAPGRGHGCRRGRGPGGLASHRAESGPRARGSDPPAGRDPRARALARTGTGWRRGARSRRGGADPGHRRRGVLDGRDPGCRPLAPLLTRRLRVGGRRQPVAVARRPPAVHPGADRSVGRRDAPGRDIPGRVAASACVRAGRAPGPAGRRRRRGGAGGRLPARAARHRTRDRRRRAASLSAAARFRAVRHAAGHGARRGGDRLAGGGGPAPGGGALGAPPAVARAARARLRGARRRAAGRDGPAGRPVRDAPGRLRGRRAARRPDAAVAPARVADRADAAPAGRVSRARAPGLPFRPALRYRRQARVDRGRVRAAGGRPAAGPPRLPGPGPRADRRGGRGRAPRAGRGCERRGRIAARAGGPPARPGPCVSPVAADGACAPPPDVRGRAVRRGRFPAQPLRPEHSRLCRTGPRFPRHDLLLGRVRRGAAVRLARTEAPACGTRHLRARRGRRRRCAAGRPRIHRRPRRAGLRAAAVRRVARHVRGPARCRPRRGEARAGPGRRARDVRLGPEPALRVGSGGLDARRCPVRPDLRLPGSLLDAPDLGRARLPRLRRQQPRRYLRARVSRVDAG